MKIFVCSDKFKYTFSSFEISQEIAQIIKEQHPEHDVDFLPVSDGGEGFLEALNFDKNSLKKIKVKTSNSVSEPINTYYYIHKNKAYIESAKIIGLDLLTENKRNPMLTSTFGLGSVILDAYKMGVNEIILGLGGSSTNDAGIGMAEALGIVFYDSENKQIKAIPQNLLKIKSFNTNNLAINLNKIKFKTLFDVKNKLYGKKGATIVFSQQKGATNSDIKYLEKGLKNICFIAKQKSGINYNIKGSGAAGGLGFGMLAFLNSELASGANFILTQNIFENKIINADLIVTGEGKFDKQTLDGKIVSEIIKIAEKKIKIICGSSEFETNNYKKCEIIPIFENNIKIDLSKIITINKIKNIFRNIKL